MQHGEQEAQVPAQPAYDDQLANGNGFFSEANASALRARREQALLNGIATENEAQIPGNGPLPGQ